MSSLISQESIRVESSSYVDPHGFVFRYDGRVLRALHVDSAPRYLSLLSVLERKRLLGKTIVPTRATDYRLEGQHSIGAILEHETIEPLSYCVEWPPEMLKAAALLTLELCLELAKDDLTLQDAYPWNVQFIGTLPLFIDFTSIIPVEQDMLWCAYSQFCNFFLYPLYLYSLGRDAVVRNALYDYLDGLSPDLMMSLLPTASFLRRPGLITKLYLPLGARNVIQRLGGEKRLNRWAKKVIVKRESRIRFFAGLQSAVSHLKLPIKKSAWRDYHGDLKTFLDEGHYNQKQKQVSSLLDRLQPSSVVDIGCNRGGYAVMAARRKARVTALDTDASAVSLLYNYARENQLSILPLIVDVTNPTHSFGQCSQQFPSAAKRFSGDLVLALALIHHLAFTKRQSFGRIVESLSGYAKKWLLVEFVSIDDEKSKEILVTNRRNLDWYTLDNFISALRKRFQSCSEFPSDQPTRRLILCEK